MNKKTVYFTFACTLLPLLGSHPVLAAQIRTAKNAATQETQTPGDIYRGKVFGSDNKTYDGVDMLGERKAATKKNVYDTSLIRAIKVGDPDRVKTLMYAHVDVNEKNYAGIAPLAIAAEKGNMEIIKMLVENGKAEINDKSSYGVTPIIAAAAAGNGEVISYLMEKGADASVKDDRGNTPLIYAARLDQPRAVESLVKFDNSFIDIPDAAGNSPLIYAAQNGLNNNVKVLLTYGALPDFRNLTTGTGALAAAAAEGNVQVIRTLVKNGHADINLPDQSGRSPMFYAINQNKPESLRTLIKLGADINAQDLTGMTPLMLAASKNYQDCLEILLRQKTLDINLPDFQGRSALVYSTYADDLYPLEKLLAAGADINAPDFAGNTPLMNAIKAQNEQAALALVQHGADVAAANNSGETAYTLIQKYLPNSSLFSVLDIKHAAAVQDMQQVQAQRLAEVRALEQQLAQDEEVVNALTQQQEAATQLGEAQLENAQEALENNAAALENKAATLEDNTAALANQAAQKTAAVQTAVVEKTTKTAKTLDEDLAALESDLAAQKKARSSRRPRRK